MQQGKPLQVYEFFSFRVLAPIYSANMNLYQNHILWVSKQFNQYTLRSMVREQEKHSTCKKNNRATTAGFTYGTNTSLHQNLHSEYSNRTYLMLYYLFSYK